MRGEGALAERRADDRRAARLRSSSSRSRRRARSSCYESLQELAPLTDRVRVMGAQALTYCHLAAGRTDAVVCLKPSRSVDFAAAQLIVRERGFAIELIDDPPLEHGPARPEGALTDLRRG